MDKTPVPLRDKYTKIGEVGIALGENNYEQRESALTNGERLSLLSEGQAWPGSPGRRCILGARGNCRGPETTKHRHYQEKEKKEGKKSF